MKVIPIILLISVLSGCNQNDIEVYRIAKPPAPNGASMTLPEGHPPIDSQAIPQSRPPAKNIEMDLHWDLPEGWSQTPGSGMRVATIRMGSNLEMSVIRLRGDAGGLLANINRWRGQLNLDSISEAQLKKDLKILEGPLGPVQFIDYENAKGTRLITGILSYKDFSWFFKSMGPTQALGAQEKTIQSFLAHVHAAH